MDLGGLRALVRDLNFQAHGVPALVAGVSTRIIWLDPTTENVPNGEFPRSEPKRIMAIRRDEVPAVPRGTLVATTEHTQTAPAYWRVDSMLQVSPDHHRVAVVPVPAVP